MFRSSRGVVDDEFFESLEELSIGRRPYRNPLDVWPSDESHTQVLPGVYRVKVWGEPVGIGASDARYCTVDGVVKVNTPERPFLVANEYACARLGAMRSTILTLWLLEWAVRGVGPRRITLRSMPPWWCSGGSLTPISPA